MTSVDIAYEIINEWTNDTGVKFVRTADGDRFDVDKLALLIADAIDTIELRDMARQSGQSAFRGPQ